MEHHHVQKVGQDYGGKKTKNKNTPLIRATRQTKEKYKGAQGSQQVVQGLAKNESNLDSTARS